jgi:hypothetical protein
MSHLLKIKNFFFFEKKIMVKLSNFIDNKSQVCDRQVQNGEQKSLKEYKKKMYTVGVEK